jgi:hypothetical protein
MTPKEKAEELVDKMQYPMDGVYVISHVANELALIAVDEILKNDTIFLYVHHLDFWKEVKNEIEKL